MEYLTNIPQFVEDNGLCKVLLVRNEVIHFKHILTEIFVRQSIDINKYLQRLDMTLFQYMEYMTNRLRRLHKISRDYTNDVNRIVKDDRNNFFPTLQLYKGLENCIILDFDGVTTKESFRALYELCCLRAKTIICSANPCIAVDYFINNKMLLPNRINSMKGKSAKIKQLIEIQKKHDFCFYVDDEVTYLEYAWLFGIKTFQYTNNKIINFSLNTK